MILISGGTGTIGQALCRELLATGAVFRVGTRDVEKARAKLSKEVGVVLADPAHPDSLSRALDGADALFLVATPGPNIVKWDRAFAHAAKAAAVKRIVKLSSIGADESPPLIVSSWHQRGEAAVKESGVAWTFLRPAGFATNSLAWAPDIRANKPVQIATLDGKQGIIDPRDIAAIAARALLSSEHGGKAYTLTGPELLSAPEQLELIGRALGKSIPIDHITPEAAADRYRVRGMPEEFAAAVREGTTALRNGVASKLSDDVERVLGRKPRTFAAWVDEHIASFR